MASAVFLLDSQGNPLLSRNYRGDVPLSAVEDFPRLVEERDHVPCFSHQGVNYLHVSHQGIYVLALARTNVNAMELIVYLNQLLDLMKDYLGNVEEESIRDNFVVLYELFDEAYDFGFPQITDAKVLKEYVTQESFQLREATIPSEITSAISWRPADIFYKKNELFLDVIEEMNMTLAHDGTVIKSELLGHIDITAYLSGMPHLKLGLNDAQRSSGKHSKLTVDLKDAQFHQCVQLEKFEKDRNIEFIPPDGKFQLMKYRIEPDADDGPESTKRPNALTRPLYLVETDINVKSHSRVLVSVKMTSQYKKRSVASFVEIKIPVPKDADSPRFSSANGTVYYMPEEESIVWRLKNVPGGKTYAMKAELQLSSIDDTADEDSYSAYRQGMGPNAKLPVRVNFEIPYLAVSGLQVKYLKVTESRLQYPSLPWVRYLTKSGNYHIRVKKGER